MLTLQIPETFIPIIFQALGELPLRISGPVFSEIQRQVAGQTNGENGNAQKAE